MVQALVFIGGLFLTLALNGCRGSSKKEEEAESPQPQGQGTRDSYREIQTGGIAIELENLFTQSLPGTSAPLQSRLKDLTQQAYTDPRAAMAYNVKEIRKYAYFVDPSFSPADRLLLRKMDRGEISVLEVVRLLDDRHIAFVKSYKGQGNPLDDPYYENSSRLNEALYDICDRRELANAFMLDADRILKESNLLNAQEAALLRLTPTQELLKESHELQTKLLTLPSGPDRVHALRRLSFIDYLVSSRGVADIKSFVVADCQADYPSSAPEACLLKADLLLARSSPNPFDNASIRHSLLTRLEAYYKRYLSLSPEERSRPDVLMFEGEIGIALRSGNFGPAFGEASLSSGKSLIPSRREHVMTWKEMQSLQAVTEIATQDFPAEIQALAQQIKTPTGENLWDYIQKNTSTIILTRRAPDLGGDVHEPNATANRLTRAVILDIDGEQGKGTAWYTLLSTLAHEAYHIDYYHNATLQNGSLAKALLLNERNAHLFQAHVLREIVRLRLEPNVEEQKKIVLELSDRLIIGLAANEPLGYDRKDSSLRTDLKIDLEKFDQKYPTAYVPDYLTREGTTVQKFYYKIRDELGI